MSFPPSSSSGAAVHSGPWTWSMEYAFSLVLDHMAQESQPRGISVPDLFRCRAVSKRWKEIVDHNHGERWHLCVPASVHGGKRVTPRSQLLKCLFMKEMNLCTQRRHLAEAYYLVYLQDKVRKQKRGGAGSGPSTSETEAAGEGSARAAALSSEPPSSYDSLLRHQLERSIQTFAGFSGVAKPCPHALKQFCEHLVGASLGTLSQEERQHSIRVARCVDVDTWAPPPVDILSKDVANEVNEWSLDRSVNHISRLERKLQVCLWLYCFSKAQPGEEDHGETEVGGEARRLEGSHGGAQDQSPGAPPSPSFFRAYDNLPSAPRNASPPTSIATTTLESVIRDFLRRFYVSGTEDNLKRPLCEILRPEHWPTHNLEDDPMVVEGEQALGTDYIHHLRQLMVLQWHGMVRAGVDGVFSNESQDLDSLFAVMQRLSDFESEVCKEVVDRHVKRVAKHYVNETLPKQTSASDEPDEDQDSDRDRPASSSSEGDPAGPPQAPSLGSGSRGGASETPEDARASTSKRSNSKKRKKTKQSGSALNLDAPHPKKQSRKQSLQLDLSVLPDSAHIRRAVEERWKEETRRQSALLKRPELCKMCVLNRRAKDCKYKMCATCCNEAKAKMGKNYVCERHAACKHGCVGGDRGRKAGGVQWNNRLRRNAIFFGNMRDDAQRENMRFQWPFFSPPQRVDFSSEEVD